MSFFAPTNASGGIERSSLRRVISGSSWRQQWANHRGHSCARRPRFIGMADSTLHPFQCSLYFWKSAEGTHGRYSVRHVPGRGFRTPSDDCTFETLRKEFAIRDRKIRAIAEMIHDADLSDEKFGRAEGMGLDRVLCAHPGQQHGRRFPSFRLENAPRDSPASGFCFFGRFNPTNPFVRASGVMSSHAANACAWIWRQISPEICRLAISTNGRQLGTNGRFSQKKFASSES